MSFVFDFYTILLDKDFKGNMKYGQQSGDFEEGVLFFMARDRYSKSNCCMMMPSTVPAGYCSFILIFSGKRHCLSHPPIRYFGYAVNEALFLSDKEQKSILGIMETMAQEYKNNIDKFSER
ncbi:hypothetical protein [Chitinophaga pinensis]|uniref:hypothetical protein n=1 Tax=Chitinophaga pinensis TaxID=79329 RepID=UPI0028F6EC8A|nr:hypothetical protein [Chitinophaga pinensis]